MVTFKKEMTVFLIFNESTSFLGEDIRHLDLKGFKKALSKIKKCTKVSLEYMINVDPSERLSIDVSLNNMY